MRYISAPQRSHFIASSEGCVVVLFSAETTGVMNRGEGFFSEGESTPAL
jgi:hypothetical protein